MRLRVALVLLLAAALAVTAGCLSGEEGGGKPGGTGGTTNVSQLDADKEKEDVGEPGGADAGGSP